MNHRLPAVILLLVASLADAATVRLRSKANGNIIEAEVIEVTIEKVSFRLAGGERLYSADWESLDADWIRRNSPSLWAERELLLKPAEDQPKEKKPDPDADPFAKESPPADTKEILRNLAAVLEDRLRGPEPGRIENFCRETGIDEAAFWKAFEEMRRASGTLEPSKEVEKAAPSRSSQKDRDKDFGRDRRDPSLRDKEESLRRSSEKGSGTLSASAYLKAVAEGGSKGRIAWQMLRHNADDRKAILDRLQKYERQAADLSQRAESTDIKRDALVLRKQLADLITSLGRVNKENPTQEERFRTDCVGLLSRLGQGR
jgi:hypothetical protein